MLEILQIWQKSHFDTRFYRVVSGISFWKITFYLLVVYSVLGIIAANLFYWRTWPRLENEIQKIKQEIATNWPADQTLKYDGTNLKIIDNSIDNFDPGATATNSAAFYLPLPSNLVQEYSLPSNLAYFDLQWQPNLSELEASAAGTIATPSALLVITRQTVFLKQASWSNLANWYPTTYQELQLPAGTISAQTWERDLIINNSEVKTALSVGVGLIRGPLLLPLRALFLLFFAWLFQPVTLIFGQKFKFLTIYRSGLFLLPLAEEAGLLLQLLYPNRATFSFWLIWILLMLVVTWANRPKIIRIN